MDDTLHKFDRKEGIQYIPCEHLQNKLMQSEAGLIWAGDKKRFVLCPICSKLNIGDTIVLLATLRGENKRKIDRISKTVRKQLVDLWKRLTQ
jgi:hypothetical protein